MSDPHEPRYAVWVEIPLGEGVKRSGFLNGIFLGPDSDRDRVSFHEFLTKSRDELVTWDKFAATAIARDLQVKHRWTTEIVGVPSNPSAPLVFERKLAD